MTFILGFSPSGAMPQPQLVEPGHVGAEISIETHQSAPDQEGELLE